MHTHNELAYFELLRRLGAPVQVRILHGSNWTLADRFLLPNPLTSYDPSALQFRIKPECNEPTPKKNSPSSNGCDA